MQSTGTPWYILVAVAIITTSGVLLAQVVAGMNERRRWQREREWQRETFWREKRSEIFSDFLRDARECQLTVSPVSGALRGKEKPDFETALGLVPDTSWLRLIASDATREVAEKVSDTLRAYVVITTSGASASVRQMLDIEKVLGEQMPELEPAFRSDLGNGPKYTRKALPDVMSLFRDDD